MGKKDRDNDTNKRLSRAINRRFPSQKRKYEALPINLLL